MVGIVSRLEQRANLNSKSFVKVEVLDVEVEAVPVKVRLSEY